MKIAPPLLCLCALSFANMDWTLNQGQADFHVLHQWSGTRSAAMGSAHATGGGLNDLAQSPLSSDTTKGLGVSAQRVYLPKQIGARLDQGIINYQGRTLRTALILSNQSFNALHGYDDYGRSTGDFAAGSFGLGLDLQHRSPILSTAVRGTWFHQKIAEFQSQAFLLDGAASVQLPWELKLGLQFSHLGWASPFQTQDPYLPLELSSGISHSHQWNPLLRSNLLMDFRYRNDEGMALPLGSELLLGEMFALRAGYELRRHRSDPSGGLGLNWNHFHLDYAISSRGELGMEHRIGISKEFQ